MAKRKYIYVAQIGWLGIAVMKLFGDYTSQAPILEYVNSFNASWKQTASPLEYFSL